MSNPVAIGAICLLLVGEFLVVEALALSASIGVSITAHDISVLGLACTVDGARTCSPWHSLFNFGVAAHGVLAVAGILLTRSAWPAGPVSTIGLGLIGTGAVGVVIAGLVPLDANVTLHIVGASGNFVLANLGLLLIAIAVWREQPKLAAYTAATAALSFGAFILYAFSMYLGLGRGTMERIAAYPHTIWYMVVGTLLLSQHLVEPVHSSHRRESGSSRDDAGSYPGAQPG